MREAARLAVIELDAAAVQALDLLAATAWIAGTDQVLDARAAGASSLPRSTMLRVPAYDRRHQPGPGGRKFSASNLGSEFAHRSASRVREKISAVSTARGPEIGWLDAQIARSRSLSLLIFFGAIVGAPASEPRKAFRTRPVSRARQRH
jgi:hypothetical protein